MTDTPAGGFTPDGPGFEPPAPHHGAGDPGGGWPPAPPGAHGDPTTGLPHPGGHEGPGAVPPPYAYEPVPTATPGMLRRAPQRTDNVALSAIICSGVGLPLVFCCVGVPLCAAGVIMGFFAQKRIRQSQGALTGSSMAALAIVLGAAGLALMVVLAMSTAGQDLIVRRRF